MLSAELDHPLRTLRVHLALDAEPARTLALAGPSGAGKTTVLRAIAGLLRPSRGRVGCGEEVWLDTSTGRFVAPERRRCGVVFQDYALFGHMSAWRNVAYGMAGVPRRERRAAAVALLERFGIGALADARPGALSGGERQRVALARALGVRPRALLLDEPLSALDARTRASAARELAAVLREAEVPAIVVTHDFVEAAELGREIAVIEAGAVVQRGTAAELAGAPRNAFVAGFTGASVLPGLARARADGLTAVALDGGGEVLSSDVAEGPVAAVVHPWDVTLADPAVADAGVSAQNRLPAAVTGVTALGTRSRVALALPAPLAVEVTSDSVARLGLRPGAATVATWKATVTRLVPR
jgi:molybdate transport system ATP-binding protein